MTGRRIPIFGLPVLLFVAAAAQSCGSELQIVNPILYINCREPEITTVRGQEVINCKVLATIFLYNAGKENIRVATKPYGISTVLGTNRESSEYRGGLGTLPDGTLLLGYDFNPNSSLLENKAENLPKIPVVLPESAFEIVDLRPGEAAAVSYQFTLRKEILAQTRNLIFEYRAENAQKRYSFQHLTVISKPYPLDGTKTFHRLQ